jgi:hypothetical protein
MEQIKCLIGFFLFVICLVYISATIESKTNNEILLKRTRRIIRGHLAEPGQVINK